MSATKPETDVRPTLRTLPGDDVRQILLTQGSDPRPSSVEEFAKFVADYKPEEAIAILTWS